MCFSAKACLITVVIVIIEMNTDAFPLPSQSLMPSQVVKSKKSRHPHSPHKEPVPVLVSTAECLLVPSRVITSRNQLYTKLQATSSGSTPENTKVVPTVSDSPSTSTAMPANAKTSRHRRKRGRRKGGQNQNITNTTSGENLTENVAQPTRQTGSTGKRRKFSLSGNLPDIHWRAVTLEHLRQHPRFESLPPPQNIKKLKSLEDARMFRQDSSQWDDLHDGRCTTSQAVAALGFLEPLAGEVLGVPRSWRRGSTGAFYRLRAKALRNLEEMNKVLCGSGEVARGGPERLPSSSSIWEDPTDDFPFAARYRAETTEEEYLRREKQARKHAKSGHLGESIRMMWGNTQESTALLTALNYFSRDEPGMCLREVGMCGAGLDLNQTDARSSLLVGATPDALLVHADGRIEALEVKNHCPFATPNWKTQSKQKGNKNFQIRDYPFDVEKAGVFSHYIPQLMMEMLCVGPECRSAVMVRQTATQGAMVIRMHRDEDWIEEMLYWLHRFQSDYVEKGIPPPENIFWKGDKEDSDRYRRFVNRTLEIKKTVQIVSHIPSDMIQRVEEEAPFFLD
jgi:hypothetical protein